LRKVFIGGMSSDFFRLAVPVDQLQAGLVLEARPVHRLDRAEVQRDEESLQRPMRPGAFEIVLGPEQAGARRSALAPGEGAQAVEPPGDRTQESASRRGCRS